MVWSKRFLVIFGLTLLLTGCQQYMPSFETPGVEVTSIQMLPSNGLEQNFEVGLKVSNPNARALKLKGMSYSVTVEGFKLATGVTSNIPAIAAYESTTLKVPVSTSLMNGLRLVQSLLKSNRGDIAYLLEAKLDTGIAFMPKMTVVERGKIELGAFQNTP